jgi:hypothetical protein
MTENFIPCAFVNSMENPVGYGNILGFHISSNEKEVVGFGEVELVLSVVEQVKYRHPQALNEAVLTVPENRIIARCRYGDHNFTLLYSLYIAQQNVVKFVQMSH